MKAGRAGHAKAGGFPNIVNMAILELGSR